jgi:hypothetical protein
MRPGAVFIPTPLLKSVGTVGWSVQSYSLIVVIVYLLLVWLKCYRESTAKSSGRCKRVALHSAACWMQCTVRQEMVAQGYCEICSIVMLYGLRKVPPGLLRICLSMYSECMLTSAWALTYRMHWLPPSERLPSVSLQL